MQNNRKRHVNAHIPNNQKNITHRRNRRQNKQNTNNKEEYWIDNFPPENTDQNYPPFINNFTQQNTEQTNQDQQHKTTIIEETTITQQPQPETTITEGTPISQQPTNAENDIDFLSPPMVSTKKITSMISEAINTSTPTLEKTNTSTSTTNQNSTKPKQYNKKILNPIIYKKGKILPQEKIQDTAVKNATDDERKRIIALSVYYQIGRYDPFNAFIVNNRNRNIIKKNY